MWTPTLVADAEYCATMTLYGRNDRLIPAIVSNPICTKVELVEAAPSDGCSFHGRPTTSGEGELLALLGLALGRRRRR